MTKPLARWVMQRYSLLWNIFGKKEFEYEEAVKVLKRDRLTSLVLSELKKHGWLTIKLHPEDSRKRIYRLKSPEDATKEMIK